MDPFVLGLYGGEGAGVGAGAGVGDGAGAGVGAAVVWFWRLGFFVGMLLLGVISLVLAWRRAL